MNTVGGRILVAEDSPTQAERVRLLLEGQGYRVELVANGREGLERVRSAPPDLIISDVNMPEMDGYAFCRAVKSAEATRRIPFVLLTERRAPADILLGLERGADNFITKPFEDDYLLERVRRILEHVELRQREQLEMEVRLRLGARTISISPDRQQIIELLFSTLEELDRLGAQRELLAGLVAAARSITGEVELPRVLERIVEESMRLMGADRCRVMRSDPEAGRRLTLFSRGLSAEYMEEYEKIGTFWAAREEYQAGRPWIFPDAEKDPRGEPARALYRREGIGAYSGFPLLYKGEFIGTLIFYFNRPRHLLPEEVALGQAFAEQAAIALHTAELYQKAREEARRAEEALGGLRRAHERMARLQELSRQVAASLELKEVLDSIARAAVELLGGERSQVFLLEEGTDLLRPAVTYGPTPEPPPGPPAIGLGEGIGGEVALRGEPEVVGDLLSDRRFKRRDWAAEHGLRSYIAVPILAGAKTLGFVNCFSRVPSHFSQEDASFLSALAEQAALAIENAKLYRQAREEARRAEGALDDLREAQGRMIQSEKLSALGRLIAGVSHELNNPLAVISGFAQLWARDEKLPPPLRERAGKILDHARRCERIVQNLLSFARERKPSRVPVSVHEPLARVMELRAHQLTLNQIQVEVRLAEGLPAVHADPHQLEQVFLNLVNNAEDALLAKRGGERRLTIETGASEGRVWARVSDTGVGIPRGHLDRIFEPFFTTKEPGKGTGLGLGVVLGIVNQHGGEVAVESEEGAGTTFTVTLPLGGREVGRVLYPPGKLPAEELRGRRLLVLEDEPELLEALGEALAACGARVERGRDGEEGLERVAEQDFDAILCDVRMPRMNGAQFLERLREVRPGLVRRVVFMTGSDLQQMRLSPGALAGRPLVSKPVELEKLVALLASVCGGRVVA